MLNKETQSLYIVLGTAAVAILLVLLFTYPRRSKRKKGIHASVFIVIATALCAFAIMQRLRILKHGGFTIGVLTDKVYNRGVKTNGWHYTYTYTVDAHTYSNTMVYVPSQLRNVPVGCTYLVIYDTTAPDHSMMVLSDLEQQCD